jgi:hypothetical protein
MLVNLDVELAVNCDHPRLGALMVAALRCRSIEPPPDLPGSWPAALSPNLSLLIGAGGGDILIVSANVMATTRERAEEAQKLIWEAAIGAGHQALVKRDLQVELLKDFNHDVAYWRSCRRFYLRPVEGPVEMMVTSGITGFGPSLTRND